MLLARGRYWQASLRRGGNGTVVIASLRDVPEEDVPELVIEVPVEGWNRVVKLLHADRKLLGGLLLDHARHKDHVSPVMAKDRLYVELQRIVLDATQSLVESGTLGLSVVHVGLD